MDASQIDRILHGSIGDFGSLCWAEIPRLPIKATCRDTVVDGLKIPVRMDYAHCQFPVALTQGFP